MHAERGEEHERERADGDAEVVPTVRPVVELDYGPDGWDHLGTAASALTVVLVAAFGVYSFRRRRRSTEAS